MQSRYNIIKQTFVNNVYNEPSYPAARGIVCWAGLDTIEETGATLHHRQSVPLHITTGRVHEYRCWYGYVYLTGTVPGAQVTLQVTAEITGTPAINDTFNRLVFPGWGTADTGQPWDTDEPFIGPGSAAGVVDGTATVEHLSASTLYFMLIGDEDLGDIDESVTVSTNAVGGVTGAPIQFQLLARYVDGTHNYAAVVFIDTDGSVTLWVDSASLVTGLTYTGSESYRLRFRVEGDGWLRAKVWDVAGAEPDDWMIDIQMPPEGVIRAGRIGVVSGRETGNTNDLLMFSFESFEAGGGSTVLTAWRQTATLSADSSVVPVTVPIDVSNFFVASETGDVSLIVNVSALVASGVFDIATSPHTGAPGHGNYLMVADIGPASAAPGMITAP